MICRILDNWLRLLLLLLTWLLWLRLRNWQTLLLQLSLLDGLAHTAPLPEILRAILWHRT